MMMIIPIMLIIYLVVVVVVMVPCWFILKKAGFTPWLSLLCIMTLARNTGSALRAGLCGVEGGSRAAGILACSRLIRSRRYPPPAALSRRRLCQPHSDADRRERADAIAS